MNHSQKILRAWRLVQTGKLKKAAALFKKISTVDEYQAQCLHALGQIDMMRGNPSSGIDRMRRAVRLEPLRFEFYQSLAEAYHSGGHINEAEYTGRLALRLNPYAAWPHNILGLTALDRKDPDSAVKSFLSALKIQKVYPEAMNNLSAALIRKGDFQTAEKYLRLLIKIRPDDPRAWNNLGLAYKEMKRFDDARQALAKASAYLPSKFNLGQVHLFENRLKAAWPLYELRHSIIKSVIRVDSPAWKKSGDYSKKTLLILPEQGLGDTLMMSRFFKVLPTLFDNVIAVVQDPLEKLFRTAFPELRVLSETAADTHGIPPHDLHCPVMSLPHRLGINHINKVPADPWLNVNESPDAESVPDSSAKLRIGLNWAGNPSFRYDRIRSGRLSDFKLLLEVPDIEWHSLHKGYLEAEADEHHLSNPLKNARDFLDTARFLKTLDLVISTETAIPNLSAAMGIPTLLAAAPNYDWRWKSWYENVTICVQEIPGDWAGVVVQLLEKIKSLLLENVK